MLSASYEQSNVILSLKDTDKRSEKNTGQKRRDFLRYPASKFRSAWPARGCLLCERGPGGCKMQSLVSLRDFAHHTLLVLRDQCGMKSSKIYFHR